LKEAQRGREIVFFSEEVYQASEIFEDAISLQNAGAVGIMLTAVSQEAAELMRDHLTVPTIGIGYVFVLFSSLGWQWLTRYILFYFILALGDCVTDRWYSSLRSLDIKILVFHSTTPSLSDVFLPFSYSLH
jgi:hypothetical protein